MPVFDLERTVEILASTPDVLDMYAKNYSIFWLNYKEDDASFSLIDVFHHLIELEKTDWIPRMKIILSDDGENTTFKPVDRYAQTKERDPFSLAAEFRELRKQNIAIAKSLFSEEDLEKTAIHPGLGKVSLEQLLCTWATHDLNHLNQLNNIIAQYYQNLVGPWSAYLGILQ